jgi:hypothetical protein
MQRRSFVAGLGIAAQAFPPGPSEKRAPSGGAGKSAPLGGVFVDMAAAGPSEILSATPGKGHWRAIPFQVRNGAAEKLRGTVLIAGPETGAPTLTIDPKLEGPYEVFVGLPNSLVYANRNAIRIKLDNDPCFVPLAVDAGVAGRGIQDCRFRAADMTGRRIQIATADLIDTKAAAVAYIRAVKIPESKLDSRQPKGMRMVTLNDGFSYLWERGICTEDRLWEDILIYRDSGYQAMQFCITGADHCNYPTKVGTLIGDGLEDYPRTGDRYYTECVRNFLQKGIDPVASTMRFTRSIGLEYHLSIRMEAFASDPAFDYMFMSKFYAAHPELRCRDLDGREIARMSYAFPEVRDHIYAILDEMAAYHPEGINLIFPRSNPYVLYEEPFLAEFRRRHGTDARKLPEFHPDVVALRSEIMTDFVREVRRRLRAKPGKPIELSAIVLADRESNRNFGLDVVRWVQEGLLDEISPSVWNGAHAHVDPQMGYLVQACKQKHCRLIVNMLPRQYHPDDYLAKARQFIADGAEGFSMWDLNGHHARPREWALLKAVGQLKRMAPGSVPAGAEVAVLPFVELGGFTMDRYPAGWSF